MTARVTKRTRKKKTTASSGAGLTDLAKRNVIVESINNQYGEGSLMTLKGTPMIHDFAFQIPTGSFSLDTIVCSMVKRRDGTWRIGLPSGKLIEVIGKQGSGKTTLCGHLISNAQAMGQEAACIDVEHAVDPVYFRRLGVKNDRLFFSQPNCGEDALGICEKLLKSNAFGLIVVDSVAALIPRKELEGEIGQPTIGLQARLMSEAMRKIRSFIGINNNTVLVFTNQMRYKAGPSAMFGNPETTPGGEALKYYSDIRIDLRPSAAYEVANIRQGHWVKAQTIKNKVAPPYVQTQFPVVYGCGFDFVFELIEIAIQRGIITGNPPWYSIPGRPGPLQGKEAVRQALTEDRSLGYGIYDKVLTQIMYERGVTPFGERLPDTAVPDVMQVAATFAASTVDDKSEPPDGRSSENES